MTGPVERVFEARGRRVAARVWGPEHGPRVLALHGWLDNACSFDALAAGLPSLRIVAVDLPGHGLSDHHAPGAPYHHVDWVTDVTAIVDALGWTEMSIVGHSMGAAIASLFAGTFPDRVRRLVLIDGVGPLTEEPEGAPERLATGVRRLLAAESKPPTTLPSRRVAAERMCATVPGLSLASAEKLLARGMVDVGGGVRWRADPRLRVPSLLRLTRHQAHAFLRQVRCPTLIVRATEGYPFDEAWMRGLVDSLSDAKIVTLPGGHHLHMDEASEVIPYVREHLASS